MAYWHWTRARQPVLSFLLIANSFNLAVILHVVTAHGGHDSHEPRGLEHHVHEFGLKQATTSDHEHWIQDEATPYLTAGPGRSIGLVPCAFANVSSWSIQIGNTCQRFQPHPRVRSSPSYLGRPLVLLL